MPSIDSTKNRGMAPGWTWRIIEPKPSTVPIRVNEVIVGSRTPARNRYFVCATFGNGSGHSSSGASRTSVPNVARCDSCHATIAGTRFFVRGGTYTPSAVKPPWQRTPPAITGSATGSVASSSCSLQVSCRSAIAAKCKR